MSILSPEQRAAVPGLLAYRLKHAGSTIGQLGSPHPGDRAQIAHRDEAVWHKKSDIDAWIAEQLRLPPALWGPDRRSNDLMIQTSHAISKLRRRKAIADWSGRIRTSIFRLADRSIEARMPEMSPADPPAGMQAEHDMRTLFLSIISKSRKDNTYKFALGKTLLDYCISNAPDGDPKEISYEYLSGEFLKHYWHQRYKFRMKQDFHVKKSPRIIQILEDVFGKNPSRRLEDADEDDLETARRAIRNSIFGLAKQKKGMVVPRFQRTMSGTSVVDNNLFYDYDDYEGKITLKPDAHRFFREHYGILMRALLAEWVRYLERANHGLPMLAAKLYNEEAKRGPLTRYRRLFLQHSDHCFYCNGGFGSESIHVDHFIPWSYIFEDSAWNLVLACQGCNLEKRDSLPPDRFVKYLIDRDGRYSNMMPAMARSLYHLSSKRPWQDEIQNHYTICKEYGFGLWGARGI